jgi:cytochrome c peroxidase
MRSICGQVLFSRLLFFVFATLLAGCGGGSSGSSTTSAPAAAGASLIAGTAVAAVANATILGAAALPGDRASLGRQIFTDRNLSEPRGTACVACHQTNLGFAGNNGSLIGVAVGSKPGSIGLRNAMTNAYSGFIPKFGFNTGLEETEAIGGHFWDGRSDTLSLQALAPFLNPLEMNNPDRKSVVDKIAASTYAPLFKQEFGAAIFTDTDAAFTQIGLAIEAFERSTAMQSFSSKYDAVVRAQVTFTPPEARGMALFMDAAKGNCAACHLMNPTSGKPEDSLFSEFTYYAIGIPRNTAIPRNSDPSFYDLGLCGPERTAPALPANALAGVTIENFCGKFRMPTLRNVAERQAFMHNGFFKDLRDVVRFYSNRKITSTSNDLPAKYQANIEKVKAPFNRAATDGPALSEPEVNDIVAFLRTLSDGYRAP